MAYGLEHSQTHSLTRSLIHSVNHSLTHSLIHSVNHSLTQSLIHSVTHTLTQSLIHSVTHTLTQSLTHSLTYSVTHSLIHSLAHSRIHSVNHTLTHSLTVSLLHTISVSLCLSVCLSLCLCLSVCLCFCLAVCLSSGSPQGIYQLHYAPGYTQSQLLRLITEIYDGVPESFEVFYCHPLTTQEELKMFMERVKYHPLPYLILQVNKLPFNLQEVCKMYQSVCLSFYSSINVCARVYILGLGRRWENGLRSFVSKNKRTKVRRFTRIFINVGLTLIGYTKPPKQDYCFITRTSVVPVSVSIQIKHRWTEK